MKRKPTLQMKYVQYLGEVGCGQAVETNVYPFMPKSELMPVAIPEWMPAQDAGIYTVRGLSLSDFNIFNDDRLLVRTKFLRSEITPDTICIVFVHSTGETLAKRIIKGANTLTLKASGGDLKDIEYSPDEVEIRGIVIDVMIDINAQIARAREIKSRQHRNGKK